VLGYRTGKREVSVTSGLGRRKGNQELSSSLEIMEVSVFQRGSSAGRKRGSKNSDC
jgi:hypothetical protein